MKFSMNEKELVKEFKSRPLAPELDQIIVGQRTLNYAFIDSDKEVLVVFIHGSPGSWNAFVDYFKIDSLLQKVDMISIDRPGFGDSDRGWPEPSMEKQAYYLHQVIETFSHKKKILVGHSLGGPVIARMTMDYPDYYSGAVYLAPSIDPEMEKNEWYRGLIQTQVGGALTPEDFWVSNEEIVPLKEELVEMLPLWSRIKTPAIVVQGTKDVLVPPENAEFARNMLPDTLVEVRYLERVNHFIPWSHPQVVVQAILDMIG
jgi:pimeloyl-ACP methyl ester carboxylesterase